MTDLLPFSYEGRPVRTVLVNGQPWFVAADVTAVLGYGGGARNAIARLPERMRGVEEVNTPGGEQRMTTISESGVYRLVLRSSLPGAEAFQDWLAEDVIPAIRREGGYISPAATADQLTLLAARAEVQTRVLRNLHGIVDPYWLEAKARHVAARALGEEPEVDPDTRPLTVGEYLQERGITGVAMRKLSPKFGKRLKAAYIRHHGRAPLSVERFVDGALRPVAGYTERDRPVFDQVWNDLTESP